MRSSIFFPPFFSWVAQMNTNTTTTTVPSFQDFTKKKHDQEVQEGNTHPLRTMYIWKEGGGG